MSEQETQDSDKLMIVETGRRKGKAGAGVSSGPPMFDRQVVGRHVIYKSNDGSRLSSMAEVRRYFKNRGHPLVESQFDFSPPAATSPKKANASSVESNLDKSNSRQKAAAKTSPSKSTAVGRRELADDLKTIKNALKQDEVSNNEPAKSKKKGANTAAKAASPVVASSRRAGRLKIEDQLESNMADNDIQNSTNHQKVEAIAPAAETPAATSKETPQTDSDEKSKNRPSRQRRPNQRYTDLISETEPTVRKKPRKEVNLSPAPAIKEARPVTRVHMPNVTPLAATSMPRAFPALQFRNFGTARAPVATMIASLNKKPKGTGKRGRPKKNAPASEKGFLQTMEMPVVAEMLIDREENMSPMGAREFEAPPEFVEIHDASQEDLLPPVLPAAPSSSLSTSLFSTQMAPSGVGMQVHKSSIAPDISYRRVEPETSLRVPQYSASGYRSIVQDKIINPIKRGRKPTTNAARGRPSVDTSPRRRPGRPSYADTFGRSYASFGGSYDGGSPSRNDHGLQGNRFMDHSTNDSPPVLDTDAAAGNHLPRGIARLQYGDPGKTIKIGRYGAKSAASSSLPMSPDPPPELELYGLTGGDKATAKQSKHGEQLQRADPNMFCHLPPEVVSDHCYGRQPNAPSGGADDKHRIVGKSVVPKSRYTSAGSPLLRGTDSRALSSYRKTPHYYQTGTPSPPPYYNQRHGYAAAGSSNVNLYSNMDIGDFRGATGSTSTLGGQQLSMLSDKLPANILEGDDGDLN